jgi:hypothetical protein
MVADQHGRIRIRKRWRTAQEVESCAGQGILIRPTVEGLARQLLWRSVGDRTYGDVGRRQAADFISGSSDSEVSQQNPTVARARICKQDVGGLHISMQQVAFVGVVECFGNSRHDSNSFRTRHPMRVANPH